ncbi:MAG: DNA polymerase III subunit delta' [Gemmatimonadota bacterium]|nr:DNA polymerase III subunit delta' [Gemmatimonadota bacterium]
MAGTNDNKPVLRLTELLDKELQQSMLEAALAGERLGSTLLFSGPDGSGKSSLAFWLAAALNCTVTEGGCAPCGNCPSCRKVEKLIHPDVHWIPPVPGSFYSGTSRALDEGKLAGEFEKKRSSPWLDLRFSSKAEHHLAAVARIREEAVKSRFEGRHKVFVITGADRLRIEAANAFLKLLEEPLPQVVLILCSDRPSSLLPTILSRCQRLSVGRPHTSTAEKVLVERFGIEPARASRLVAAADGNLTAALRMNDQEDFDTRKSWVDKTIVAALDPSMAQCHELLEDRSGPMWNRGDFERYLTFLSQSVRDILVCRLEAGTASRVEYSSVLDPSEISDYAKRLTDNSLLINLLGRLVSLQDQLDRNVNLRLLGLSILQNLRKAAIHGSGNR